MNKRILPAIILWAIVGCSGLCADTVNSFACSTPATSQAASTSSGCWAQGSYGYARAGAQAIVTLPGDPRSATQVSVESDVAALLAGIRGIGSESMAQSTSNTSIYFDTAGPMQSGFLELTFQQQTWTLPAYGSVSEQLTIGSYSLDLKGQNLSLFIPIELGTAFNFDYIQTLTGYGDAGSGVASGSVVSGLTLQAFEADKTTAVALFDPPADSAIALTPEPASLGIVSLGVLLMFSLQLGSRRSKS